jgi:hypothetical protein
MDQHHPKRSSLTSSHKRNVQTQTGLVLHGLFIFSGIFLVERISLSSFRVACRTLQTLAIHKRVQKAAFNYVKVSRNSRPEYARAA